MTTLLAIDTASPRCSVALSVTGRVFSRISDAERQAAQDVLPLVQEVFQESGQTIQAVDAIAVVSGPGSFTGIRIGIGAAQGLALANHTPLLAISSLALLSRAAARRHGGEYWLVCTAARDEEVYFGAYHCTEQAVTALVEEQVGPPGTLRLAGATAGHGHWQGVGAGWERRAALEAALEVELKRCSPDSDFELIDLVELAAQRFARGESRPAELVTPNYVKEQMNYHRPGQA